MKKHIIKIIGVIILIFILKDIDFGLIWSHIRNCSKFLLLVAVLLEVSCIVLKSAKWRVILGCLKVKASFSNCLRAYWSGLYLSAVTPGKVGDISRVFFLKKDTSSIARPIFSVIFDRLTDLLSLLLLGLAVSFFYLKELSQLSSILLIALAGMIFCVWVIFLKRDFFYKLFKSILYRFIPKEKAPLKEDLVLDVLKEIGIYDYFIISLYVLAGWAIYFLGWWFLMKALHINMSFFNMVAAVNIATIVSLIPVSINGLGTRDAAIVFIFSKIGILRDSALSFSLMIFAVEMFIVCSGIIFLLNRKNKINLQRNA